VQISKKSKKIIHKTIDKMKEKTMAKQIRKKKKRRKKNYLLRLLILIALGVSLYFFLSSTLFDVQRIAVEGNHYYTAEQIIERSDAAVGVNLFFGVDKRDVKGALLTDPYIKNVTIKRRLPSTLKIVVEERKEAAAVLYNNNSTYILIDKDGMVLRKSDVEPKLTLLEGLTISGMGPGSALEVEENSVLTDTLSMLEAMEDMDMSFKKIDISNVIIKAYIYDQLICRGTPENILQNMTNGNLEKVLYKLYTEGTERGIISLGSDGYCTFSPMVE